MKGTTDLNRRKVVGTKGIFVLPVVKDERRHKRVILYGYGCAVSASSRWGGACLDFWDSITACANAYVRRRTKH